MCDIPKFVVTGGPCGGKSTGLAILRQKLAQYGVSVLVVPELATQLFTNGFEPARALSSPAVARAFQREMLRAQLAMEDRWMGFARAYPSERKVLVCDRGALDPAAYMPAGAFDSILHEEGLSLLDVRDARYAAVFHLVTAADGAEAYYNLDNAARTETPQQARDLDARTLAAWTGHPHLEVLPNRAPSDHGAGTQLRFDEKMERLLQSACRILGLPVPQLLQRKFRVLGVGQLPASTASVALTQTYLQPIRPGIERRLRRITPIGSGAAPGTLLVYTEKRELRPGVRIPTERILTRGEYETMLREADPARQPLRKTRHAFTWEGQYFRIDEFHQPEHERLLEIEVTEARPDVAIPPFVHVGDNVTDQPEYLNAYRALRS